MTDITWTNDTRKLSDLVPWERNPKRISKTHAARLLELWERLGQFQTIAIGPSGEVYDGHQRLSVLKAAHGGKYEVQALQSSRALTEKEREELTVAAHVGTVGQFDWDALSGWDVGDLQEWGFDTETLTNWQTDIGALRTMLSVEDMLGVPKDAKPNPRNLPIDVIYTLQMADCTCCLAVQAGLKYGIQSAHYRLCPYTYELTGRHEVAFIDNDYFNYDHATHLKAVMALRPKYATVKDVMTPDQCARDKIEHTELAQILDWAEELAQYTDNVIVIPKYDCFDQIPDKFVLGYSVPTSHGGTPLPVATFKGRRVHLLGGSWKAQLAHMTELGDDVVSLDTNYVQRQARLLGAACTPDGLEWQLSELQETGKGFDVLTNPRYVALGISFGAIGAKVNELYAGSATPAE